MNKTAQLVAAFTTALLLLISAAPAQAQATRTWVSGVGDDVNPCSRTAPCKTFPGAISKTAAGGEIDCLDPGGFGTVTITKSITLDCGSGVGSILNFGVPGVIVNGNGVVATLRNLSIDGGGTGTIGVKFTNGAELVVEHTTIFGQSGIGLDLEPTANSSVYVKDVVIHDAVGGGVLAKPVAATVNVVLDNASLVHNGFGLRAEDNANVAFRNSSASANTTFGIFATSSLSVSTIQTTHAVISGNTTNGVQVTGAGSTIRLSDSDILFNGTSTSFVGGTGSIFGYTNNRIAGNGVTGPAPTGTPQQ